MLSAEGGHVSQLAAERKVRADFVAETEAAGGLVFCPSYITEDAFLIFDDPADGSTTVYAVDFTMTSFLPPSFVVFALRAMAIKNFACTIGRMVELPVVEERNLTALNAAYYLFCVSGGNKIGSVGFVVFWGFMLMNC